MIELREGVVTPFIVLAVLLGATACLPGGSGAAASPVESAEAPSIEEAKPVHPPTAAASQQHKRQQSVEAEAAKTPADSEETALARLETIAIKGRAPKTGYDRDLFGNGWKDPDRNGCDARNDMLNRDLTDKAHKSGTGGCVVTTGVLADPLTATTVHFVRGNATSSEVQIDHVVPLSDAWQKGAQQLAPNQREAFGNDPLNLLATDGSTNASKGDGDAATWLPPNKSFRCEYVALQTAVKAKYGLWMTQAEHDAINGILTTSCPDQPVPADKGGVSVPVAAKPAPAPQPVKEEAAVPAPVNGSDVYYQNCSAVRAAGAAPIRAGNPGWESKFDRDGDGVGCE
jgi:hypothetical protein